MFDLKARRACDYVNSSPSKDICFHLLFSSNFSYEPWDCQSPKIGGAGTSFQMIMILIWKCISVRNLTCLFTSPFHQFTDIHTAQQVFITKCSCQSHWTAHACIILPKYPWQLELKLVCSHYYIGGPLLLTLSRMWQLFSAGSIDTVSLFLSSENAAVVSQWGYSGVPNSALWPLFASFSHFLFDFKRGFYPPQRATFYTAGPANRGQKAVLSSPPLQTRVSAKTERAKALTVSFPDLVCKSLPVKCIQKSQIRVKLI